MAMVVYGLLTERGLSVPNDISVVGFDDYPLITRLLRPQLSSVAIAFDEIGRRAVRELMAQIETQAQAAVHYASNRVPGTPAPRDPLRSLVSFLTQQSGIDIGVKMSINVIDIGVIFLDPVSSRTLMTQDTSTCVTSGRKI